jgi:3-phosphoshikimate 1-carboxyvinyltransferase
VRSSSSTSVLTLKSFKKMRKAIIQGRLKGTVYIPSSKSVAHRILICAALSDLPSKIRCTGYGKDVLATADCLNQLGAGIEIVDDIINVSPVKKINKDTRCILNCGESGSTLRFLLPIAAALDASSEFRGEGRLPQRPLSPLYEQMVAHGVSMSPNGSLPLTCDGKLKGGRYTLGGNVSSQFVSGLLMALPLADEDSEIIITGQRESTPYIDITIDVMKKFGVDIVTVENGYQINGGCQYRTPGDLAVEGDWSGAAFWIVAGCIGKEPIRCQGISYEHSVQGDRAVVDVLRAMGADIRCENDSVTAMPSQLHGIDTDCKDIPDLVPALAIAAAMAEGNTVFYGIERLRLKESDRVATVCDILRSFNIECSSTEGSLTVIGGGKPKPAIIDPANDHRIAMAAAIMASVTEGESVITDTSCTEKSYPQFFRSFMDLGGNYVEI